MYAIVVLVALGAQPSTLVPVPDAGELARAEAEIQEVFGGELRPFEGSAAARLLARSRDRRAAAVELAGKMIATAEGSRPAARYALLVRARDLAIAAGDSSSGVRAVEGLAKFAGPADPSEGHRLWSAAKDLRGKLAAAEIYFRCVDELTGFQKPAVEKRLRELGWKAGPIDFQFEQSAEGWVAVNHIEELRVEGGCLVGRITGNDPIVIRSGLAIDGGNCPVVRIRLAVKPAKDGKFFWITKDIPRWGQGKAVRLAMGAEATEVEIDLRSNPLWVGQTVTAIRIDPGDEEYGNADAVGFSIDYVRGDRRATTAKPLPTLSSGS